MPPAGHSSNVTETVKLTLKNLKIYHIRKRYENMLVPAPKILGVRDFRENTRDHDAITDNL